MVNKKFKFPEMYIEMDRLGWLDYTSKNYLWLDDIEWYSCEEIQNYEKEDGEIENIVPFAHTGNGDKWVWYIEEESHRLLVGLCYHDENIGEFYAENIQSAIFRNILEFVSGDFFYVDPRKAEFAQFSILEAREYLEDCKNRFSKWFNESWLKELDELIKLDFKTCHTKYGDYYVLLTPDEADEKIEKYLNFDLMNKTFVWWSL